MSFVLPHAVPRSASPVHDHELDLTRAVFAKHGGFLVFGAIVAGYRLLEAGKFDDHESVEFRGSLENLVLRSARQDTAAVSLEDRRHPFGIFLMALGLHDIPPRAPIGNHRDLLVAVPSTCQACR